MFCEAFGFRALYCAGFRVFALGTRCSGWMILEACQLPIAARREPYEGMHKAWGGSAGTAIARATDS